MVGNESQSMPFVFFGEGNYPIENFDILISFLCTTIVNTSKRMKLSHYPNQHSQKHYGFCDLCEEK